MAGVSSMGERLAFARIQQGLILQEVSLRSGLNVGYLSQLEKGAKVNPTIDTLQRLARALDVSLSFILREFEEPASDLGNPLLLGGRSQAIGLRFGNHLSYLTSEELEQLRLMTVEERFAYVVDFLCTHIPDTFTKPVIAFELGISVRSLHGILQWHDIAGPAIVERIAWLTGIPVVFFNKGTWTTASELDDIGSHKFRDYMHVLTLAVRNSLSPQDLAAAIQSFVNTAG